MWFWYKKFNFNKSVSFADLLNFKLKFFALPKIFFVCLIIINFAGRRCFATLTRRIGCTQVGRWCTGSIIPAVLQQCSTCSCGILTWVVACVYQLCKENGNIIIKKCKGNNFKFLNTEKWNKRLTCTRGILLIWKLYLAVQLLFQNFGQVNFNQGGHFPPKIMFLFSLHIDEV